MIKKCICVLFMASTNFTEFKMQNKNRRNFKKCNLQLIRHFEDFFLRELEV